MDVEVRSPVPLSRPAVSVIVPFAGSAEESAAPFDALAALRRAPDDELIVVDNSGASAVPSRAGVRVIEATQQASSYYARNEGAAVARNPWLLFIDADCLPE